VSAAEPFVRDLRSPDMVVHPRRRQPPDQRRVLTRAARLHLVTMAHNLFGAARMALPPRHELKPKVRRRRRIGRRGRTGCVTVERLRTLVKCGAMVMATARRVRLDAEAELAVAGAPGRRRAALLGGAAARDAALGCRPAASPSFPCASAAYRLPRRGDHVTMTGLRPERLVGLPWSAGHLHSTAPVRARPRPLYSFSMFSGAGREGCGVKYTHLSERRRPRRGAPRPGQGALGHCSARRVPAPGECGAAFPLRRVRIQRPLSATPAAVEGP
jgi:hypothetical protein